MKFVDKMSDLLNRPVTPVVKEIRKRLIEKNIGIHIRTNNQYEKETIDDMHEGARLAVSQMYFVMKYASLVLCSEGASAYWNARQFCYYYNNMMKLFDDTLKDGDVHHFNEIKMEFGSIILYESPEQYFKLAQIYDKAENIVIDYEEKQKKEENKNEEAK